MHERKIVYRLKAVTFCPRDDEMVVVQMLANGLLGMIKHT